MADTRNGPELHPMTEELATGANFASVATMLPSGLVQNQVPRITVLIRDENDPYRYAEVRGEVTDFTAGREARAHIDEVAQKYTGQDYPPEAIKSERVILWVTPHRQTIIDQNVDLSD
jgi:hypothetical protein